METVVPAIQYTVNTVRNVINMPDMDLVTEMVDHCIYQQRDCADRSTEDYDTNIIEGINHNSSSKQDPGKFVSYSFVITHLAIRGVIKYMQREF